MCSSKCDKSKPGPLGNMNYHCSEIHAGTSVFLSLNQAYIILLEYPRTVYYDYFFIDKLG